MVGWHHQLNEHEYEQALGLQERSLHFRDIKGTFHAKMGTIKDRNGMDLTEAKDVKKRWQEYTELSKKDLMTQIIMMV